MLKDQEKIKENYNKKIKLIKKHNELYHNEDLPIISDSEFDKLKKQVSLL